MFPKRREHHLVGVTGTLVPREPTTCLRILGAVDLHLVVIVGDMVVVMVVEEAKVMVVEEAEAEAMLVEEEVEVVVGITGVEVGTVGILKLTRLVMIGM